MMRFATLAMLLIALFFAASAPSPLLISFQQRLGFSPSLLTLAFAVYALAILITLLVAVSLSDYIGRRPVMVVAILLLVLASVLFLTAANIRMLVIVRMIQGGATGAASGSLTAAVAESAPAQRRRLGPVIASAAPLAGLALGGLVTGAAEELTTDPAAVIFAGLAIVFALGVAVTWSLPGTGDRQAGVLRSLLPSISVPAKARCEFRAGLPMAAATWSVGGFTWGSDPPSWERHSTCGQRRTTHPRRRRHRSHIRGHVRGIAVHRNPRCTAVPRLRRHRRVRVRRRVQCLPAPARPAGRRRATGRTLLGDVPRQVPGLWASRARRRSGHRTPRPHSEGHHLLRADRGSFAHRNDIPEPEGLRTAMPAEVSSR
jgi:hypothetical protein